jgi:6-phosphogluconolactonase (cycloisomerase 2 family)
MKSKSLVLLAGAVGASAGFIYTGAGGCDVSDTACVPPAAPYSQQINAFSQQTKGGKLYPVANYTTGGTPSWVIVPDEPDLDTKCLFATLSDINRVVSYEVLAGGALSLVSNVSSGGLSPVYLDHYYAQYPQQGKALLVGNYNGDCAAGGATVASLLVSDKCVLTPGDSIAFNGSGPDPTGRQKCSHAHSVVVDRYSFAAAAAGTIDAFVQDLGADKVYTVALELATGKLSLKHTTVVAAGSGPRHLAVTYHGGSDPKHVAYLVHEMANLVSVHTIDGTGALTLVQTLPTFDNSTGGFSKAAEIAINGDQNGVFVTNRGFGTAATNTVVGYAIDRNNSVTLEQKSVTASGVSYPRGMVISSYCCPSPWNYGVMIVAGQGSGNLVSFDASGPGGTLKLPGVTIATNLPTPTTIAFVDMEIS